MSAACRRPDNHHFVDIGEAWALWADVGFSQTLVTDAEIAIFLLQQFEHSQANLQKHNRCNNCFKPLVSVCLHCSCGTVKLSDVRTSSPLTEDCKTALVSQKRFRKLNHDTAKDGKPLQVKSKESSLISALVSQKKFHKLNHDTAKDGKALQVKSKESSLISENYETKKRQKKDRTVSTERKKSATSRTRKKRVCGLEDKNKSDFTSKTVQILQVLGHERCNIKSDSREQNRLEINVATRRSQQAKQKQMSADAQLSDCHKQLGSISLVTSHSGFDVSHAEIITKAVKVECNRNDANDDDVCDHVGIDSTEAMQISLEPGDDLSSSGPKDIPKKTFPSADDENLDNENSGSTAGSLGCGGHQNIVTSSQKQQKYKEHYQCTVCMARYSRPDSLKVHMRSHSGYRPFICEACGSAFSRSYCLATHKMTHSGEKPFRCTMCDASFTQSGKLNIHMRKHSGYKPFLCSLCGASFVQSDRLRTHMRTHSGVKPYKCVDCGKGFSHPHSLKVHSRAHTGHRPYKCDCCSLTFADPSYFRRHKAKHLDAVISVNGGSAPVISEQDAMSIDARSTEFIGDATQTSTLAQAGLLCESAASTSALNGPGVAEKGCLSGRSVTDFHKSTTNIKDLTYSCALNYEAVVPHKDFTYQKYFTRGAAAISDTDDIYASAMNRFPLPAFVVQSDAPSMSKVSASIAEGAYAQVSSFAGTSLSNPSVSLSDAYEILNGAAFSTDSLSVSSSMFSVSAASVSVTPSTMRIHQVPVSSSDLPNNFLY